MHLCNQRVIKTNKVGPLKDSAGNVIPQVFVNGGSPKSIIQSNVYEREREREREREHHFITSYRW